MVKIKKNILASKVEIFLYFVPLTTTNIYAFMFMSSIQQIVPLLAIRLRHYCLISLPFAHPPPQKISFYLEEKLYIFNPTIACKFQSSSPPISW
jgi:hypothetical protein